MKKTLMLFGAILVASFMLTSCGCSDCTMCDGDGTQAEGIPGAEESCRVCLGDGCISD